MGGWFVTGTDTGVGKTLVATGLLLALRGRGLRAVGMKPVASGAQRRSAGLRHADAEALRTCSTGRPDYEDVNPVVFAAPVAPHLAAAAAGRKIDFARIAESRRRLAAGADLLVVEGVGGWRVPLGPDGDVAALARTMGLPVILVVGVRLGCLNHARLTAEAISADGVALAGWVANRIDPTMDAYAGNVAAIGERLSAPCLGMLPWLPEPSPERAATHLNTAPLTGAMPLRVE